MNKKRISVVMATAMAASMAAVPMTASADDTVELTFMGWEASPLETQAVQDGIAKFEEQYPNIKVNYTPGLAGSNTMRSFCLPQQQDLFRTLCL